MSPVRWTFVLIALVVGVACSPDDDPIVISPPADPMARLEQDASGGCEAAVLDDMSELPSFINCKIPVRLFEPGPEDPEGFAKAIVSRYPDTFRVEEASFTAPLKSKSLDPASMAIRQRHFRFEQFYKGLPVYGGDLLVHVNVEEDAIETINNGLIPDIEDLIVEPIVTEAEASNIAVETVGDGSEATSAELIVFPGAGWFYRSNDTHPALAWWVMVQPQEALPEMVFVDALTGEALLKSPAYAT